MVGTENTFSEENNRDEEAAGACSETEIVSTKNNEKNKLKSLPKKYVIGGVLALASFALIIGLSVGLTKKKKDVSPRIGDNPADDKEIPSNPADEKERPSTAQALNLVASLSDGIIRSASSQPFSYAMRAFGPSSIDTYENCATIELDLKDAASLILDNAILREASNEIDWKNMYVPTIYDSETTMESSGMPEAGGTEMDKTNVAEAANDSPETSPGEDNSYDTNNQVKGVDEADVVKSNGKYVFTAYGNEIVVWDAVSGSILSRTGHTDPSQDNKPPIEEETNKPEVKVIMNKSFMGPPSYPSYRVQTLLLHEDRLTAILESSGGYYGDAMFSKGPGSETHNSVQVRIYNISSIPTDGSKLDLVITQDLKGDFIEARSINNYAHIVTSSNIDHWSLLQHVSRYHEDFWGLNSTEYIESVKEYLEEKGIIENFVEDTMDLVTIKEKCSHIAQLSLFQTSKESATSIPSGVLNSGVIGAYAEITTLDMAANINDDGDSSRRLSTSTSVTGVFLPNSWGTHIYASQNHLVLATPGSSFSQSWDQSTYLMTFALSNDGTRAQGHSTGQVSGNMLNQFSMDEYDGHLRVATTIRSKFDYVCDNVLSPENSGTRSSYGCIWTQVEDSDNMITILKISDLSKDLTEVGSIKDLGHPGEQIYAVRFMKEKAFMVTFRRTDPFYTFDLTDHEDPKKMGELEISGFSNYLHPFDLEANIMIAVGQEADSETGRPTGLQISLYNVTDLNNPSRIDKYDVVEDNAGYSSSAAQFEHKAFRFYKNTNKLIIPASIRDDTYDKVFNGFKVYNIDEKEISFHFDINHKSNSPYCWSDVNLSERSLVHSGILTTMRGHTVNAYDIETKDFKWSKDLKSENTSC